MRFEDSPNLFGASGIGTYADVVCEWCGNNYDGRTVDRGDGDFDYSDESISLTDFAGKQICDCCFEEIENEILSRMDDIVPWFTRILKTNRNRLEAIEGAVDRLRQYLIGE